jgi:hypothetical protein
MGFTPSQEQEMILNIVKRMVKQRILPRAAQIDQEGLYPEDFGCLRICQRFSLRKIYKRCEIDADRRRNKPDSKSNHCPESSSPGQNPNLFRSVKWLKM